MNLNDASKVIDIIDGRVIAKTGTMAQVDMTYGSAYTASSAYIYGDTVPAGGFRTANGITPKVGDKVRVAMNGAADWWVEEVIPTAYYPMQFDISGGVINWGPYSTGVMDTNLYRSAVGTLKTDSNLIVVGTLNAGASTLGSSTLASLGVTGAATVGTTLGVTGTSTLGVLNAGASTLASLGVTGGATVGGDLTVTGSTNGIVNTMGGYHSANAHQFLTSVGAAQNIKANGLYVGGSYADPNPNSAGIQFGPDVALYRDTATRLTLNGSLNINNSGGTVPYIYISGAANTTVPGNPIIYFDQGGGASGQTVLMYRVSGVNKAFTRVDNTGNFVISPESGGNTYLSWDNGGAIHFGGQPISQTGSNLPYAAYATTCSVTLSSAASGFTNISFPAGYFTQAPIVLVTQSSLPANSGIFIAKVNSNVTTTSASIYCYTGNGTTTTATVTVNVLAIQMTAASAAG